MSKRTQEIWKHNALIGSACMMQVQANNIADAPTTREAAKSIAREIHRLAKQLETELRSNRIDK